MPRRQKNGGAGICVKISFANFTAINQKTHEQDIIFISFVPYGVSPVGRMWTDIRTVCGITAGRMCRGVRLPVRQRGRTVCLYASVARQTGGFLGRLDDRSEEQQQ